MSAWWPALLLFASLAANGASAAVFGRGGTELSVTFIITSLKDMVPSIPYKGRTIAPCEYTVLEGRRYYAKRIQFTSTMHWIGGFAGVQQYCWVDENYSCQTVNPAMLSRVEAGMRRCYGAAVAAGYTGISLMHHIDSHPVILWRAKLDFNPLKYYGSASYDSGLLAPSGKALAAVINPGIKVWFSVAGEQGISTFKYPKTWTLLIVRYKKLLAARTRQAKVGTSLNRNVACACVNMGKSLSQEEYASQYPKYVGAAIKKYGIRIPDVQALFDKSDFVGISLYNPAPVNKPPFAFPASAMEVGIWLLAGELKYFGVNLKTVLKTKTLVVHELGLGGGGGPNGGRAVSMARMANEPFNGVWYPYNSQKDPWAVTEYRKYRERMHDSTIRWLATAGSRNWRVEAAFLFSVASWDVLGVHYGSTGYYVAKPWGQEFVSYIPGPNTASPNSFRSPLIANSVIRLNKGVHGL